MAKPLGTLIGAGIGGAIGGAVSDWDPNYILAGAATGGLYGYATSGIDVGEVLGRSKNDPNKIGLGIGANVKMLGIPVYHVRYYYLKADLATNDAEFYSLLIREPAKNRSLYNNLNFMLKPTVRTGF